MDPARIASLLAPFLAPDSVTPDSLTPDSLTDQQLAQVSTYLDLLLKWNARINLTSVRQPEQIITRHFGESFFTARQLFPAPSGVVIPSERDRAGAKERESRDLGLSGLIDVGSGAGFPGLPIKIYLPALFVTLVESNQKKATFLRDVIRALTLTSVDVFAGRAEDCPRTAAIVTLRAVEKPERALPAAARLVSPGGRLALLLGASLAGNAQGLLPGFSWSTAVTLPGSSSRILLTGVSLDREST
jgi:16S rRNA (guanine527-N7)-methyltransferase